MNTNGVGPLGKDIKVNGDFTIHVPRGWCYDTNLQTGADTPTVISMFRPQNTPYSYREGPFSIYDDDIQCDGIIDFQCTHNITLDPSATKIEVDLNELLRSSSQNAKTAINSSFTIDGEEQWNNTYGSGGFRRTYKLVKDEKWIKSGYYSVGFMGTTMYTSIIVTAGHLYIAAACRFATDNHTLNEMTLTQLLSSVRPVSTPSSAPISYTSNPVRKTAQKIFLIPTYLEPTKVDVGPLSLVLPDGMEYITKDHIPTADSDAITVLSEVSMAAATKNVSGGLRNHRDAPIGINVSLPRSTKFNPSAWDTPNELKAAIKVSADGQKGKIIKEGDHYLVYYVKGKKSSPNEAEHWCSYCVAVFCGSCSFDINIFFNSKKTTEKAYTEAVEEFAKQIHVDPEKLKKFESESAKEALGGLMHDNCTINGVLVAQLYQKDVIFNNDNEISYKDGHTQMTGLQLNAAVAYDYPVIVNNTERFLVELMKLMCFVEKNENLMIPKTKFHKEILKATRKNPITGITVFNFFAWHMLMITENSANSYNIIIDRELLKGIPDACTFVGEFVKTLRVYNGIYDDFDITFLSSINADGPCGFIEEPVAGASSTRQLSVKVNKAEFEKQYSEADAKAKAEKAEKAEAEKKAQEEKKRLAAEKRAEAKRKKEEELRLEEERKAAEIKKFEDYRAWYVEKDKVEQKRKSEADKIIDVKKKELVEKANSVHNSKVAELNKKIQEQEDTVEIANEALRACGLFELSKKKEQKSIIFDAESKIDKLKAEITDADTELETELSSIDKRLEPTREDAYKEMESKYPFSAKPEKCWKNRDKASAVLLNDLDIYCRVRLILKKNYPMNIDEILDILKESFDDKEIASSYRVTSIITTMLNEGIAVKTVISGLSHYSLANGQVEFKGTINDVISATERLEQDRLYTEAELRKLIPELNNSDDKLLSDCLKLMCISDVTAPNGIIYYVK